MWICVGLVCLVLGSMAIGLVIASSVDDSDSERMGITIVTLEGLDELIEKER